MKLTNAERHILMNQYDILARLSDDEKDKENFQHAQEALYNGYYELYDEFLADLYEERSFDIVFEILNMYRDLLFSHKQIEEPNISKDKILFKGFDGNEEAEYYSFVKFLINKIGKYQEQRGNVDGFNTHRRMLPKYLRQLEVWRKLKQDFLNSTVHHPDGFVLTEDQIVEIIEA